MDADEVNNTKAFLNTITDAELNIWISLSKALKDTEISKAGDSGDNQKLYDLIQSKYGLKYKGFEDINRTLFDDYFNYCVKELNYTNDTIKKHIYTFKTFLRWALDEKYHNVNITNYVPKMRKELNENVYLADSNIDITRFDDLYGR